MIMSALKSNLQKVVYYAFSCLESVPVSLHDFFFLFKNREERIQVLRVCFAFLTLKLYKLCFSIAPIHLYKHSLYLFYPQSSQ